MGSSAADAGMGKPARRFSGRVCLAGNFSYGRTLALVHHQRDSYRGPPTKGCCKEKSAESDRSRDAFGSGEPGQSLWLEAVPAYLLLSLESFSNGPHRRVSIPQFSWGSGEVFSYAVAGYRGGSRSPRPKNAFEPGPNRFIRCVLRSLCIAEHSGFFHPAGDRGRAAGSWTRTGAIIPSQNECCRSATARSRVADSCAGCYLVDRREWRAHRIQSADGCALRSQTHAGRGGELPGET